MNLSSLSRRYLEWSSANPPPPIPAIVAKTGAGSEARMPFTHYANVVPVYLFALETLARLSKTYPRATVLDHGCGTGRPLSFLARQLPQVHFTGIDQSPACIDYAISRYSLNNLKFQIDQAALQMPHSEPSPAGNPINGIKSSRGAAFDLVISSHVLEHIPPKDADSYLSSLSHLLKPGGILVLGTPNRKWLQDLFLKNPRDHKLLRLVLPHEHEYTYSQLRRLISPHFPSFSVYGLKNPANARFSLASIKSLLPNPDNRLLNTFKISALNLSRLLLPQKLTDILSRNATDNILTRLKISYSDLLTQNRPLKGFSSGLNFIVLASNAK